MTTRRAQGCFLFGKFTLLGFSKSAATTGRAQGCVFILFSTDYTLGDFPSRMEALATTPMSFSSKQLCTLVQSFGSEKVARIHGLSAAAFPCIRDMLHDFMTRVDDEIHRDRKKDTYQK